MKCETDIKESRKYNNLPSMSNNPRLQFIKSYKMVKMSLDSVGIPYLKVNPRNTMGKTFGVFGNAMYNIAPAAVNGKACH